MAEAQIIDGKQIAAELRGRVAEAVAGLKEQHGIAPGLAVVLVGEDPASQVYVGSKAKQTVEAGMRSFEHRLPAETGEAELLALVAQLNADDAVDGILVQLPLPKHINSTKVLEAIDPAKDVDGFHPINAGRLATGERALAPCTPVGCIILAKTVAPSLKGLEAVVVGRSNIVGKPVAQLLLREDCTVTIAHSRTRDLSGRRAPRRSGDRRRGPAANDRGQLDQARRNRHRCRHQPDSGRQWQDPAGGRRGFRQRQGSGRRHHPGARRRRADDGSLPSAQYGGSGLRAQGHRDAGDVTPALVDCLMLPWEKTPSP